MMDDPLRDEDDEAPRAPEVKPDSNGLFCFLNGERECGADCMAYLTEPNSESPHLGLQQKNCILLVSVERLGRSTAGIASLVNKAQQASAKEAADRMRQSHPSPPDPRGTK
jgi:hypothetical protein